MAKKRLTKSNNSVFAGVLGGIADYFNWDPTLVRVLYVIISFFSSGFPGILVYLVLMLVMPDAPKKDTGQGSKNKRPRKDVTDTSSSDDDWSDY
ncbi:PspC domain-containing protein [Agrilactobacillus fermenti]|uniref:PspC domain-containing protein n=1 Tax=Agrilactobacillus fermenti TaxID=2586909 RepID=UPI001E43B1BA|nr:PspC domain-containing protein [Agrilactobacillus fermenti]MCD2256842.1 PspC domain-containing protein [Agrilactobacillus fermenti]